MKNITPKDLRTGRVRFDGIEIFPEAWITRKSFSAYEHTPRPKNALFFICSDMEAVFLTDDGERVTAHRGDTVYIPCGICYRAEAEGGGLGGIETYTVNFRMICEDGEEAAVGTRIKKLTRLSDGLARLHCERMYRALEPAYGEADRLRAMKEFFSLADAAFECDEPDKELYYPIRAGVEALQNEWNKNEKIEKYAELCGISSAHFYNCFRACFSKSPVEYRNFLRITNACTMLRSTEMRIGEISQVVGFDDQFYFCRVFTEKNGMSPKKYREMFRAL